MRELRFEEAAVDLVWFVVVAMFVLACLTTYGFFLNVEDARREQASGQEVAPVLGTLVARLDAELAHLAGEASGSAVLRRIQEQELALASACAANGRDREAAIHTSLAASAAREATAAARTVKIA